MNFSSSMIQMPCSISYSCWSLGQLLPFPSGTTLVRGKRNLPWLWQGWSAGTGCMGVSWMPLFLDIRSHNHHEIYKCIYLPPNHNPWSQCIFSWLLENSQIIKYLAFFSLFIVCSPLLTWLSVWPRLFFHLSLCSSLMYHLSRLMNTTTRSPTHSRNKLPWRYMTD